jgi:hypothetical protein
LIFIKKGGEIRLCETLATNPGILGKRCQNLIPEKTGDDKNKHGNNESISFNSKKLNSAAPAYGHGVLNLGESILNLLVSACGSRLAAYQVPHTAR